MDVDTLGLFFLLLSRSRMNGDSYRLCCFSIGILSTSGPFTWFVQQCVRFVGSASLGGSDSLFLLNFKGYSLKGPGG